ncbi:hypothetical protein [Sphingomonas xinjiangensis]|uniref:Ca2+/Na+ antiporter n=1 Tax=Sphingomonas xinjiangensis TaxID=643568 RepID=A0A840YPI6_9SPHN|nr:hypothetical protein [Sphingomonas xinjiangensis]MBB5710151.1 Ca2+/Na+ antiporter [Sphingomonas xinjiangensis]
MAPNSRYRWLQIAGIVTLVLAAAVLVLALRHQAKEKREREDIGLRAQEMMNQIEAEAQRMEKAAAQK